MIGVLAGVTAVLSGVGVVQSLAATWLVARFARRRVASVGFRPSVTVLKPLHGDEPLLEVALTTLFRQDYANWQIVFGVQHEADPAVAVVRRLQRKFSQVEVALVVDPTLHGANRKVGNLINMLPAARHDVLVIADSDVHVRPDYLSRLIAALQQPDVGLVTMLYAGIPAVPALVERLGAAQITYGFLPGAVLARAVGRQDCLGATMCLRRQDLTRIGGLSALVDHLADDNVLGRRIASLGLRVALANTLVLTTVPEPSLRTLFRHELRWARTIRTLEPAAFAASVLQYPLAWALLTILLTASGFGDGVAWAIGWFLIIWMLRALAGSGVDRALGKLWAEARGSNDIAALAFSCPVWLLPLRDLLSVAVMLASYGSRQVDWRGHGLRADTPPPVEQYSKTLRPIEGTSTR